MKLLPIFASGALGGMMHSYTSPCDKVEYFLGSKTFVSWEEAKNECASRGMDLALPRSVDENAKLLGFMFDKVGKFDMFWIGAYSTENLSNIISFMNPQDTKMEGTFLDTNNRLLDFSYWAANQPNDYNNNEDCTIMGWLRDGAPEYLLRWNDAPCNGNKRFACEKRKPIY